MPERATLGHDQREQAVLADLEAHFPDFTGRPREWTPVAAGQDPPDFISDGQEGRIGLELTEWLDGEQMTAAKGRESQRDQVHRILVTDWEHEYRPKNFRGAFLIMGNKRISRADEAPLRKEFFAHAAEVDAAWITNPERTGKSYCATEFPGYPHLAKYFAIRYIGGEPHGLCWIHASGDGGAYDPYDSVAALTGALDKKLIDYAAAEKQCHLNSHGLTELGLLVHGGFNVFAYNTPSGLLSLEDIARRAPAHYAAHPQCTVFDCVWFFDSLDAADDINKILGMPHGRGTVRWLAQLWPHFRVY
jgi:hypothetical protein